MDFGACPLEHEQPYWVRWVVWHLPPAQEVAGLDLRATCSPPASVFKIMSNNVFVMHKNLCVSADDLVFGQGLLSSHLFRSQVCAIFQAPVLTLLYVSTLKRCLKFDPENEILVTKLYKTSCSLSYGSYFGSDSLKH